MNLRMVSTPEDAPGLVSQFGDARSGPSSPQAQQQTGQFVSTCRDPLMAAVDALVAPRDQFM